VKVVDSMNVSLDLSPPQLSMNYKQQSGPTAVADPTSSSNGTSRLEQVVHAATKVFGVLLGMDPASINRHDDFFNLGGDSLLAIQVLSELRKTFKVQLPGSMLMSYPTPAALGTQVARILDAQNESSMDMTSVKQQKAVADMTAINDARTSPMNPLNLESPHGSPIETTSHSTSSTSSPQAPPEYPSGILLSPVREDAGSEPTSAVSASGKVASPHSALSPNGVSTSSSSSPSSVKSPMRMSHRSMSLALDAALTLVQTGNVDARSELVPLYMVHPIGGELYYYRDLAPLLGLNRPVYGFRAVALDGRKEPFADIRSMAKSYVNELLDSRRRALRSAKGLSSSSVSSPSSPQTPTFTEEDKSEIGPILLGGVSFGGTVAYEMALILSSMGFKVPLLVLVDAPAPGGLPTRLGDAAGVLEYIAGAHMGVTAEQLRELSSTQHTDVVTAARNRSGSGRRLPSYITDSLIKTWLAHEKAMFSYEPPPTEFIAQFTGEVLFIRPTDALKHTHLNMHLPWIELVPQGVRICRVPGNHITMNSKALIHNWANILKKVLDQIDPIQTQ
jgi:thioesterase domain-containing protein/acyl carrier protein